MATLPTALALLLELSHAAEVVPDCRWAAEGLRRAVGEHPNPSPNPSPNPNPNQETGLVDLPSRIWQAYHAQTASAALEQVDDPLGAVPMTPVAAFMM